MFGLPCLFLLELNAFLNERIVRKYLNDERSSDILSFVIIDIKIGQERHGRHIHSGKLG